MSTLTDEEINARVGARIRELRVQRGFKQRELAELVGVTAPAFGNYEKGRRLISTVMVIKVAAALGVHPALLVVGVASNGERRAPTADLARLLEDVGKHLRETVRSE